MFITVEETCIHQFNSIAYTCYKAVQCLYLLGVHDHRLDGHDELSEVEAEGHAVALIDGAHVHAAITRELLEAF